MTPAFASESLAPSDAQDPACEPTPRVALLCDFREEYWPSMDLVGDMLFQYLAGGHSAEFSVERVVLPWRRRFSGLPLVGNMRPAYNADRLVNRLSDFPRWLQRHRDGFDLFHIVDHSYSQLALNLPPDRTLVTCHDLDTFRCLLEPDRDPRPRWFRALARRTLKGFQRAAHVICVSEATRTELQRRAWFREDQLSVIHSGVHPDLSPATDRSTDEWARQLVGEGSGDQAYLLHVGSTAQRKRIDLLLEVFASILPEFPNIRMVRVGERFTESQAALASRLGLDEKIVCVSGVQPDRLGALYRGAAVLLQTSDREGFGLPVIEALSCGCCVVASDIPPLREAGGNVATYCPVADISAWSETVKRHLRECSSSPSILDWRRTERKRHAAKFNWSGAASQTTDVYRQVLSAAISHRPPLKTDRPLSRRTCL